MFITNINFSKNVVVRPYYKQNKNRSFVLRDIKNTYLRFIIYDKNATAVINKVELYSRDTRVILKLFSQRLFYVCPDTKVFYTNLDLNFTCAQAYRNKYIKTFNNKKLILPTHD